MTRQQIAKKRQIEALKKLAERNPQQFAKFVFPLIGRMAERDIINELVAVQPMNGPTAEAFYLDFRAGPDDVAHRPPWLNDGMDDGLVRNAEALLRRRAEANIVDTIVNVLEHQGNATQEQAASRLTFKTLFGAILKAQQSTIRLATD